MSAVKTQPDAKTIVNDFAITIATENGSGSQTANGLLMSAIFAMGIPVGGKNLFPSNIQGMPTWYIVRASKDGYTGRLAAPQIVVAFNEVSAKEDIAKVPPGGVALLRKEWNWNKDRNDIIYYEIAVKEIMDQIEVSGDLREQLENMVYIGALAQLFGIPLPLIEEALNKTFKGKASAVKVNMDVTNAARDWTAANVVKKDPYRLELMDKTQGKLLITGNVAAALGTIYGGVTVVAWYPITPATTIVDTIIGYKNLRKDLQTGKSMLAVIQAEDELAAAGMIVGAGWAGARSMTATSGPGLSLMGEFTGMAYYAEIPCVIWDVTRVGPSTGLPTRTSQGDLLFAHFLGHGDTRHPCLLPATPEEAFEFGWKALDIAAQLQTPVFVLSDLELGMNRWMSEPFQYPDTPVQRGKVLDAAGIQAFIDKHGKYGRYWDVDGDGIGYRSLPGTEHPRSGYLTRGTGHDPMALYSERSEVWQQNMARLRRKMETARKFLPQPLEQYAKERRIGLITFGPNESSVIEARDKLTAQGLGANYLRVRSLPLHDQVRDFIHKHTSVYVVENNFDGQLLQIIRMEYPEDLTHVRSVTTGDGLPMTPESIIDAVKKMEGK